MRETRLWDKTIGDAYPTYIAFEIGHTHNGFENAKKLVKQARMARADAIKVQAFYVENNIVETTKLKDTYSILTDRESGETEQVVEPLLDSFKRQELTYRQYEELSKQASLMGLDFIATVDSEETIDAVAPFCQALKICSADVNYHRLLAYAAATGVALMIDTGSATLGEIEEAVNIIEKNHSRIVIHHCASGYPARLDSIDLRTITTLRQMFPHIPIAFSDHYFGWEMDVAAISLGANMIEKTITLDRTTPTAEHIISLEYGDMCKMVKSIRELEKALGNPRRIITEQEMKIKIMGRSRSLYAARDMDMGERIKQEDIMYRRPGTGLSPQMDTKLVGKMTTRKIKKGELLDTFDFEK